MEIWKDADREDWRSLIQSPHLKVRHPKTKLVRILEEARLYDEFHFIVEGKICPRKLLLKMGSFRGLIGWCLREPFKTRNHFLSEFSSIR